MTAGELQLIKEFLGREIKLLRGEVRDMREDNAHEHELVRGELAALAHRVDVLEDTDATEASRRQFRRGLLRAVLAANSAAAVVVGLVLAIVDHI